MNEWGIPDWRDAAAYGDMSGWTFEQWRWEFMRRQPDLRAYFDERADAAFKARCELASDPNCYPGFVAEMTCGIDDPRFTLLEDKESKSRFGYLRLHNPRVSGILQSQYLTEWDDDTVAIADPGFMQRTMRLEDWQIGVAFDLTRPIKPQLAAAAAYLDRADADARADNLIMRFRMDLWPRYLRILDAKAAGASHTEIGRMLFPGELGDTKDKAHKNFTEQALEVVFKLRAYNPPP